MNNTKNTERWTWRVKYLLATNIQHSETRRKKERKINNWQQL